MPIKRPMKTQMALNRLGSKYGKRSQILPGEKKAGRFSTGFARAPPIIGPTIDLENMLVARSTDRI